MRIITIKIGSSVLLTQRNKLDEFRIAHIADQIQQLKGKGVGAVLVVSGAVACGVSVLSFSTYDQKIRKMAAGIGQVMLISVIERIFAAKGLRIAQMLLTRDLLESVSKGEEINQIIRHYLKMGIIPVINENDVIDLNSFGGNDFLGARLTILLGAKHFLVLSTLAGSSFGVGGGEAKMQAIDMVRQQDIQARIVDGKAKNILLEVLS